MATINADTQATLIGIHIALFDALPGATHLAWMTERFEAGLTPAEIAQQLTLAFPAEYAPAAPPSTEPDATALFLAQRMLGTPIQQAFPETWAWALAWAEDKLVAGTSYAAVVAEAATALLATPDPVFRHVQATLKNQIAFARHVALDLRLDPQDVPQFPSFVALITIFPESVDDAKQQLAFATVGGTLPDAAGYHRFYGLLDGAVLTAGAGDDGLRATKLNSGTLFGADLDGNGFGAVLDMGAGRDELWLDDLESPQSTETLIVGRNAEIRNVEYVRIEAYDRVVLAAPASPADTRPAFTGTEVLSVEIQNQTLFLHSTENDNLDGSAEIDLARFDSALQTVLLKSEEREDIFYDTVTPGRRPGAPVSFTLHNVPSTVQVYIEVNDVTSYLRSPTGVIVNDSLMTIDRRTAQVTTDSGARDVSLQVSFAEGRNFDDAAAFTAPADADLRIMPTRTDTVGASASSTDDDAMLLEHLTLSVGGSVDLNGFGDVAHRLLHPAALAGDVSSPVETSLDLPGAGGFDTVYVDGVNADTITMNNGVSAFDNERALVLRVDAENNYRIRTISGADLLDLRADTIRADDNETSVNRADLIDAGGGYDTLIIRGDNHLGRNDLTPNSSAPSFDDAVFGGFANLEEILVDTGMGAAGLAQMITLGAAAANSGLDRIRFTGNDAHAVQMVIGENYRSYPVGAFPRFMHVDTTTHEGDMDLVLKAASLASMSSYRLALDLRAGGTHSVNGDNVTIIDAGNEANDLYLYLTTASGNTSTHLFEGPAHGAGDIGLTIARGSLDRITLVDGGSGTAGAEATNDTYVISEAWTSSVSFDFDASAIADTDGDARTGGIVVDARLSDARMLSRLIGSQNQDLIRGGVHDDSIYGAAGNDTLVGGNGRDYLTGDAGEDTFVFGASGADGRLETSAAAESLFLSHDAITDFATGVDSLTVHLDSRGHIVNLGRFASGTGGEVLKTLEGGGAQGPVVGDALYSAQHRGLAIDVDGNGYIDTADFALSVAQLGAGDIGYAISGADSGDLMRAGAGTDTLHGFAGNDTFVALGSVSATDRSVYEKGGNAAAAGIVGDIAAVLSYDELLAGRQGSEGAGDTYDGGEGVDFLHLFGTTDLASSTLRGIEWVVQHGSATYTLAQLGLRHDPLTGAFTDGGGGIGGIALHGSLAQAIAIADDTGALLSPAQQIAAMAAFLNRAGQQFYVPQGDAGTSLDIGGVMLNGIDAMMDRLRSLLGEAADGPELTGTEAFTGDGGLYGMTIHLVGQVTPQSV